MKKTLFLILALLPLAAALFYYKVKMEKLCTLENVAYDLQEKALRIVEQTRQNETILQMLHKVDPLYLENTIEKLPFLEDEARRVQALTLHQKENHTLQKRLDFLRSGDNRISFVATRHGQEPGLQETETKWLHPVEMNEEDLKKLLVFIEGVSIHPYDPVQ